MIKGTSPALLQMDIPNVGKMNDLLNHLNKVFRFRGIPELENKNSVLDHTINALHRGNVILRESGYKPTDKLVKNFNRSMLVHDIGEIIGEFKTEGDIAAGKHNPDLDRIENKLGRVAIQYGLTVNSKFDSMLDNLKQEFAKKDLKKFEGLLDQFLTLKPKDPIVKQWLKAYDAVEGDNESFLKRFCKAIDKLDGSKYLFENSKNVSAETTYFCNELVKKQMDLAKALAKNPQEEYLIGTIKEKLYE